MNLIRKFNLETKDYADYSPCNKYRYLLRRFILVNFVTMKRWRKPILFIMLNPSTATEFKNDPTVRRCASFAAREGATELYVVNLFALRSTDPKGLNKYKDPIGPENDKKLEEMILHVQNEGGEVVAAWGSNPIAKERGSELVKKFGPFLCLGTTKNGSPRHPLYVKTNQALVEYK
jgi:hypothetical protein